MILTQLPDTTTFSQDLPKLTDNVVVLAHTNQTYVYPEHQTPCLFIANFINQGRYVLNNQLLETSSHHFFLTNPTDRLDNPLCPSQAAADAAGPVCR